MADNNKHGNDTDSLLAGLMRFTGQVAGGTLEIARHTATMTAMFGEGWLRNTLLNSFEPERLEAMADAGHFLRDARETAGLSLKELADSLGVSDKSMLEDVESGEKIMPLELVLRSASLLARHDPVPFLIKFLRTYNPQLEQVLEQWGVMALPRQYERERRFVNLYRQHDVLRTLSDDEHERFISYIDSAAQLVLDVMAKEKQANAPPATAGPKQAAAKAPARARKRPARKRS
jgi:transcriptional regulator with XRE-family HTH domain